MKTIEQYIKDELKNCPLTKIQEDKLLIGLTHFLDDLETEQKDESVCDKNLFEYYNALKQKKGK